MDWSIQSNLCSEVWRTSRVLLEPQIKSFAKLSLLMINLMDDSGISWFLQLSLCGVCMFMLSFRSVPENKTIVGNLCGIRLMHEQILFYIYVHITMNNPEKEYKRPTDQVAHLKTPLKGWNMNGVFRLATRFMGLTSNSCIQFNISFRLPESKLIQKPTSIVIRLLVCLSAF